MYRLQSGYYMMGGSKFQKYSDGYDQITAIKFWDEVAKIGEKKMVPQWSISGTYAQSITLLNGLSDTDKELLKKEVDIFVACMQNMV